MKSLKRCLLLGFIFCGALFGLERALAQEAADERRPSVDNPVVITFESVDKQVSPGQKSAFIISFKVPKYIWLGAQAKEARTPPGTRIRFKDNSNISFGEPQYPEPSVEGVPNHLGVTRVYKGELRVVVPFTVSENAEPGEHEITTYLTYTPGFSAGKLTTHTLEPHTTTINIVTGKEPVASTIPEPEVIPVPESFTVQPAPGWDLPDFVTPMFFTHKDSTVLSKVLHTIFLDPSNHGKTIKQVTYPFLSSTKQEGNNFGVGVAIIDATKEGVMTGALSGFLFNNQHVGLTGGFDLITCPAAYHNIQANVRFSGDDYQQFHVNYENLLFGAEERFGIQTEINLGSDPRFLFYGIGRERNQEEVTTYDQVERKVIADFMYTPFNKFRIGAGIKFRNVEVGKGLDDIDSDGFGDIILNDLETLQSIVDNDINRFEDDIQNIANTTIIGGRVKVIYDARNQEFNPTKGFYGEVTAEFNNITNINTPDNIPEDNQESLEDDYVQVNIDMRKYHSGAGQRFSMLFRNQWTFTTSRDIPFYELASLGGPSSIRAFSLNRFRDQHSMFASMEMRYVLMKVKIMGFPMAVMMSAFLDAGQTFNEDQKLNLGDDFNWAPGFSLRFVNYPNVGYIVNVATAEDGVNVTGGISLPF